MRPALTSITLKGYKTFADLPEFSPGRLAVLIGPNGVGKSNFISFFRLLSWALTPPGNLQEHVSRQGGASVLLCDGPERTREIEAFLRVTTEAGDNDYRVRLAYAADDTLIFTDERFRFSGRGIASEAPWKATAVGHREAQVIREAADGNTTARVIHSLLRRIAVYQFHNTSETARIRGKWDVDDSRYLKEDGANLASVLYRLRQSAPSYYRRIQETLGQVLPFFSDFELEPEHEHVLLRWREQYCDRVFTVSQAADGMLRFMALVTLLCLPEDNLPDVLILDEPELGLHPFAINILGGLIRSVSTHIQVIVATQSLPLIDCFSPADVVVTERSQNGLATQRGRRYSTFRRLDEQALGEWLEDYSLSQLYEKNVLGGRP